MKFFKLLCIVTALAVFIAGFASVFALQTYMQNQQTLTEAGLNAVDVVRIKTDVEPYKPLTTEQIEVVSLPQRAVAQDAKTNPSEVVGQMPVTALKAGTQITPSMLLGSGESGVLSYTITPGMTAITIAVNEESGLSQMLKHGDFIDILSSGDTGSTILLTGLKVVALGGASSPQETPQDYGTITLEVTRDQATKIDSAEKRGSLRFIMSDSQKTDKNTSNPTKNTTGNTAARTNTNTNTVTDANTNTNTNTNANAANETGTANQTNEAN